MSKRLCLICPSLLLLFKKISYMIFGRFTIQLFMFTYKCDRIMLRFFVVFIGYFLILVVCCNYSTCNYTDFTDRFTYKKRASFNFTVEPSVSVGDVLQFWTNTGLWYVTQFN